MGSLIENFFRLSEGGHGHNSGFQKVMMSSNNSKSMEFGMQSQIPSALRHHSAQHEKDSIKSIIKSSTSAFI